METQMPLQTGPTSEQGKRIASCNAVKHGLTSRQNLVKGENAADLEALLTRWHDAYETDNEHAAELVNAAAHAEWSLLRVQRGVDELNQQLFLKSMLEWTKEEHKQYQLFARYLTGAQRLLDRYRNAILQYRREQRAEARVERLTAATRPSGQGASQMSTQPEPSRETYPPTHFQAPRLTSQNLGLRSGGTV